MNCKKCGNIISEARLKILPQTIVCVNCSDVNKFGVINVINHKTGNNIQIVDKETADKVNKMAQRKTYGSNLGGI